jgi:hypothetical protein
MEMREKPLSLSFAPTKAESNILSAALTYTLVVARQSERERAQRGGNSKTRPKPALSKCLTYYSFTQLFPLKPPADAAGSR